MRAAVVRNPRAHGNRAGKRADAPSGVTIAEPMTPQALAADLKRFASDKVELLVIDGGDGTVREVLTALPAAFKPLLAVLASGKTNILAFDLGVPRSWTLGDALAAADRPERRIVERSPLRLQRARAQPVAGFVFGTAGYVRGTALAGDAHRARVFQNAAVALTIGRAVARTLGGSGDLRNGEPLTLAIDGGPARSGARLVLMATTLERLPFGMRPFGPAPGLKVLDVDAPPRALAAAVPKLLWGEDEAWLAARGYRRGPADVLTVSLDGEIIVDGETYPGGDLTITEGRALRFLVP